ncbi:PMM [Enterospora canceri]|uniref:Phosphomannomutase n=1 Tax=Enterospora canceri TaxID=1081671 RepID=A0A1Y1S850_9MICR|nr:PMM [Enterospora canceri]
MKKNTLFLFDVDGTLSESRAQAPRFIMEMLRELKTRVKIAFVGGSDLTKQKEQLGEDVLVIFDYGFPENGVQFYENGLLASSESFIGWLGEEKFKKLVNKFLAVLGRTDCPKKRGTFIETRNSMINVCPIGRSCTKKERKEFNDFDGIEKVRQKIVDEVAPFVDEMDVACSIGGQISIDVFPKGWDKTYCLKHIKETEIYFFGDMTHKGGNDYEIFMHPKVKGLTVSGPVDTLMGVNDVLKKIGEPEIRINE